MGTGGADSADAVRQMIHCGATAVQICSSIQNEDFSVIQDYISGLKWHLYSLSRPDLREWVDQSPPGAHSSKLTVKDHLPRFGVYELERRSRRKEMIQNEDFKKAHSSVGHVKPTSTAPAQDAP